MFARKHIWRCCHQRVASFVTSSRADSLNALRERPSLLCGKLSDAYMRWNIHSFIFQSRFLPALRIAELPFVLGCWYYRCRAPRATHVSGTPRGDVAERVCEQLRMSAVVLGEEGQPSRSPFRLHSLAAETAAPRACGGLGRMSRLITLTVTLGSARSGLPHRSEAVID